eukprot:tig00000133_g7701.t1
MLATLEKLVLQKSDSTVWRCLKRLALYREADTVDPGSLYKSVQVCQSCYRVYTQLDREREETLQRTLRLIRNYEVKGVDIAADPLRRIGMRRLSTQSVDMAARPAPAAAPPPREIEPGPGGKWLPTPATLEHAAKDPAAVRRISKAIDRRLAELGFPDGVDPGGPQFTLKLVPKNQAAAAELYRLQPPPVAASPPRSRSWGLGATEEGGYGDAGSPSPPRSRSLRPARVAEEGEERGYGESGGYNSPGSPGSPGSSPSPPPRPPESPPPPLNESYPPPPPAAKRTSPARRSPSPDREEPRHAYPRLPEPARPYRKPWLGEAVPSPFAPPPPPPAAAATAGGPPGPFSPPAVSPYLISPFAGSRTAPLMDRKSRHAASVPSLPRRTAPGTGPRGPSPPPPPDLAPSYSTPSLPALAPSPPPAAAAAAAPLPPPPRPSKPGKLPYYVLGPTSPFRPGPSTRDLVVIGGATESAATLRPLLEEALLAAPVSRALLWEYPGQGNVPPHPSLPMTAQAVAGLLAQLLGRLEAGGQLDTRGRPFYLVGIGTGAAAAVAYASLAARTAAAETTAAAAAPPPRPAGLVLLGPVLDATEPRFVEAAARLVEASIAGGAAGDAASAADACADAFLSDPSAAPQLAAAWGGSSATGRSYLLQGALRSGDCTLLATRAAAAYPCWPSWATPTPSWARTRGWARPRGAGAGGGGAPALAGILAALAAGRGAPAGPAGPAHDSEEPEPEPEPGANPEPYSETAEQQQHLYPGRGDSKRGFTPGDHPGLFHSVYHDPIPGPLEPGPGF